MKRIILLSGIFALLFSTCLANGWQSYPLGGCNAEKIIVTEDPDGAWFFSKDGGAFWINWDSQNQEWGSWQNFDAYYPWHMGGDVFEINDTLWTLNVTMQGHHYYYYNGSSWSYYELDRVENDYYYYHDAQFFEDDAGNRSQDWFLVSAWQLWEPADQPDNYKRGIYLVSNGQAPAPDATPILGTEEKVGYGKLYRDLEDGQIIYTWGEYGEANVFGFWRAEVSGDGIVGFSVTTPLPSEFQAQNYQLKEIAGFYQYLDDAEDRHQYLLAETQYHTDETTWDVWHRQEDVNGNLNADGWEIIWDDIMDEDNIHSEPAGLAAREYEVGYHYVYTFESGHGLVMYDQQENQCTVRTDDEQGDPIPFLGSHYVTRTPWTISVGTETGDMVIISAPHAGNFFAEVNTVSQTISDVYSMDTWSFGIGSDIDHFDCREVYADDIMWYMATWGLGLFRAGGELPISPLKIGIGNQDKHLRSDFNFNWWTIARSPFPDGSDTLYLGAATKKYYLNDSDDQITLTGLWALNENDDYIYERNDGWWPVGESKRTITQLCSDSVHKNLYIACPQDVELDDPETLFPFDDRDTQAHLYVMRGAPGLFTEVANTSAYCYLIDPGWLSPLQMYAKYLSLQPHPNPEIEAVIFGFGMFNCDWAGHTYDDHRGERDHKGGGVGIAVFYDNAWRPREVVNPDGHSQPWWFEHPHDILVEYNEEYYGQITDKWKKVDILAATGAWELEIGAESNWRYGGLFIITPTVESWAIADITPYRDPVTQAIIYQLDGSGIEEFQNPAVMSVDKLEIDDEDDIYFCTTSGEPEDQDGGQMGLIWYQFAPDMRALEKDGWLLYPNPQGEAGRIPSPSRAGKDLEGWFQLVRIVSNDLLTVWGVHVSDTDGIIGSGEE